MKISYSQHLINSVLRAVTVLTTLFLWSGVNNLAMAEAHNAQLDVSPTRCVALRQGQTCYQQVVFAWRVANPGNYCLVELATERLLKCWQATGSGEYNVDFQSTQSGVFALRPQHSADNLATAKVAVAWVFKSSKRPRSSWKLF